MKYALNCVSWNNLKEIFHSVFSPKAAYFFHWNVSWNLKKTVSLEYNVKAHCEINVKLVFHEILWKKNFTVYPSLKEGRKKNFQSKYHDEKWKP